MTQFSKPLQTAQMNMFFCKRYGYVWKMEHPLKETTLSLTDWEELQLLESLEDDLLGSGVAPTAANSAVDVPEPGPSTIDPNPPGNLMASTADPKPPERRHATGIRTYTCRSTYACVGAVAIPVTPDASAPANPSCFAPDAGAWGHSPESVGAPPRLVGQHSCPMYRPGYRHPAVSPKAMPQSACDAGCPLTGPAIGVSARADDPTSNTVPNPETTPSSSSCQGGVCSEGY
ncbi:hypothetical protein HUJ04_012857 [Dendroctonus ponderosae]|nr:hypothetical protein HUJ04_012857 [Dendroctonus ponderosae]